MATTSIRHLVVLELVDRVATALPDVHVDATFPGEELAADAVFVTGVTGSTSVPVFGPPRLVRDDNFDINLVVQGCSAASDSREALTRAAELLAAVEDVMANDCNFGGVDGLVTIGAEVEVNGPNSFPSRAGTFAYYQLTISAQARYT